MMTCMESYTEERKEISMWMEHMEEGLSGHLALMGRDIVADVEALLKEDVDPVESALDSALDLALDLEKGLDCGWCNDSACIAAQCGHHFCEPCVVQFIGNVADRDDEVLQCVLCCAPVIQYSCDQVDVCDRVFRLLGKRKQSFLFKRSKQHFRSRKLRVNSKPRAIVIDVQC